MKHVVIVGAGGQGRETADILRHQMRQGQRIALKGFIDDNSTLHGREIDHLPVLGGWEWFEHADRDGLAVICAVGAPSVRRRLVERAEGLNLSFFSAVSPLAHLSPFARIGSGVTVFARTVLQTGARLGDHAILNVASTLSHDTRVGRFCTVSPGVHVAGAVTIEEGCEIGMSASILQHRTVGAWSIVGAGAVVTRDVPANVTAVGVPARVIKTRAGGWHERP